MTKNAIVWIREDIRIEKNEALAFASQNHETVTALYIYNPKQFDKKREAQKWWLSKSLESFKTDLNKFNISLEILSDDEISMVVAMLAKAKLSDEKIIAGECAVPGIIALIGLFKNKEHLNKISLNSNSKVLLFGCEGLTDTEMYEKLLDDGLKKI